MVQTPARAALRRLPLVTLYLTERCNSRCVTCDYWRHGRIDLTLDALERLLPELQRLQTQVVLISGGEPLLHPQWREMAQRLRTNGQSLWLLTSGLSLAKHARRVGELFDAVTVSLDGTTAATYAAIRGLDAFDKVCEGIRAAADTAVALSVRVTLQRANYQELPAFVELAHRLGAQQVSFLAVDVANPHAFGRSDEFRADVGLRAEDLPVLAALLCQLQREHAQDFERGFIAENPAKLQRLLQYFTAVHGHGSYPPVRCNAPEFSAVVDAQGRVAPCFFIPGPPAPMFSAAALADLNAPAMRALRQDIEDGRRAECTTCVCSMWREPSTLEHLRFRPAGLGAAPRRWQ